MASKLKERSENMYSARIRAGGHTLVAIEICIYFAAATALIVATGYSLWAWGQYYHDACSACDEEYVWLKSDEYKNNAVKWSG
jgi:hypothetical protein